MRNQKATDWNALTALLNTKQKPITLIGMMGSGKTSIGHTIAQDLSLEFYDSDTEVEKKAGRSVADIFTEYGEEKFRESEHRTILELLGQGACVIATGGGAVLNPATMQAILDQSITVWLDCDIETLFDRVSKNQNRPLLHTDNPKETLQHLLQNREHIYAQAHIKYSTGHNKTNCKNSIETGREDLLQNLYNYLQEN